MKFRYFLSVLCLCFSLAAPAFPGEARGADKELPRSLSHYIMGVYCEDLEDIDRAIQEYQQAVKEDPGSSLLHFSLASAFIKKSDAESAITELNQAAVLAPEAVEPHAVLALVYA
ncbi:tetratricopeptide repeat protein, partial [bacterium]